MRYEKIYSLKLKKSNFIEKISVSYNFSEFDKIKKMPMILQKILN